jgi:signal transduction histidine kinase
LKSQLLTKVSHELRTPLGGILGYAELLANNAFGSLKDQQKQAVNQILDSTHYLALMVNELLDQAQLEAKVVRINQEAFSPADLLHKVEAGMAILARHKGLEFSTRIDPEVPASLLGDPQRIQQILFNLVGNAIKFTRQGGVQVRIFQPDPQFWAVQVIDTGAGIPLEAQAAIFEPFRQVDNTITRENRGTGLGLSITKQLVELMHGSVHLDSAPGKGSTFTILLPLLTPAASSILSSSKS